MKIGIIGSGRIGGTLARLWVRAGHEVLLSSRHPERLKELAAELGPRACTGLPIDAAQFAEFILLSIPLGEVPKLDARVIEALRDKIVMDTCNPYPERDGDVAREVFREGMGTGVWTARHLPDARVVRAFNSVRFDVLAREAHRPGDPIGVPIASDDQEALQKVADLVRDAGFGPVALPELRRAREFDPDTEPYGSGASETELRSMLEPEEMPKAA